MAPAPEKSNRDIADGPTTTRPPAPGNAHVSSFHPSVARYRPRSRSNSLVRPRWAADLFGKSWHQAALVRLRTSPCMRFAVCTHTLTPVSYTSMKHLVWCVPNFGHGGLTAVQSRSPFSRRNSGSLGVGDDRSSPIHTTLGIRNSSGHPSGESSHGRSIMKFITTHHRTGPETMSRSETHPALPLVFGFRSAGSVVRSLNSGGSEKDDWTRSNSASSSPRSMPEWVTPAASSARFISAMDGLVFEGGTDLGWLLADGAPPRSAPFRGRFAARSSPDAGSPPARISPTIKTSSSDPDIAKPSFVR